jgi:LuxR family maltose regulon positive regulatory protein
MALPSPPLQPNRLRPPTLPARTLARPQLLQQLGATALFTLVSAPLGYGKSTLLAQYAASLNTPWAWLRCAAADNQPAGFLTQLHGALKLPQAPLSRTDTPLMWSNILTYLEHCSQPFTLFLDDVHLLRDKVACGYVDELLRHPPPQLRLVAASQGMPVVGLAHLRRDNRLQVLDAHMLALDNREVFALAAARGAALGRDEGYRLLAASEGWVSGILLHLGSASHAQDPVALYLHEELLCNLPRDLLAFMERTCVVNSFDLALAAELAGPVDAAALLQRLQRRDLFTRHAAGEPLPYSYHPMLRRTLYQRLQRRDEPLLSDLHRIAAKWLLGQRHFAQAVYQFGRAREFDQLLAVIERHSFDLLREGRVRAIVDFLADVPGEVGIDHFTLAITEASTLVATNDIARASACMGQLQRLLQRDAAPVRRTDRVHQTLAFLRSRVAWLGGNFSHGRRLVDRALLQFPHANAATAVLRFNRASCLFALGHVRAAQVDAQQALDELQALAFEGYTHSVHLLLGQIELAQGMAHLAQQRFDGLAQVSPAHGPGSFYDLFRCLGMGCVLLQQNRLQAAGQYLSQAEAIALQFPHCAGLPWVLHAQACLLAAQGEQALARERWDEVRRLCTEYKLFALYRQASAWRVRLAVREQEHTFVACWLKEWHACQQRYGHLLQPEETLAYAWVQRYLGQHLTAKHIAGALMEQAMAEGNSQLQVDTCLLLATLHEDHGERNAALGVLEQALQLARAKGFGQLLHGEGHALHELFSQLLNANRRRQLELQQPAPEREQLLFLPRESPAAGLNQVPGLLEPLTRREQDVLRRVASGHTNPQIAEGLYISLSTVKTHINNLFRKLDANDRDTALQAARTLKLVD